MEGRGELLEKSIAANAAVIFSSTPIFHFLGVKHLHFFARVTTCSDRSEEKRLVDQLPAVAIARPFHSRVCSTFKLRLIKGRCRNRRTPKTFYNEIIGLQARASRAWT